MNYKEKTKEELFAEIERLQFKVVELEKSETGSRQTANVLYESEKKLRDVQRLAKLGSWSWIAESDTVLWSEELFHLNGRDPNSSAPTYAEMSSGYTAESWRRLNDSVTKAMQDGDPYELDLEIIRPDGTKRHTYARGKAVYNSSGRIVGLQGTAQDITERKLAEENLLKSQYYLSKAQEIGIIGTWELDIQKNILFWTDEEYKIFGVPIGTKVNFEFFIDLVYCDDREYVQKKWNAGLNNEPYDVEHRILVNGEIKWLREKGEVKFDIGGNPVFAIGVTQDITKRKKTEEALKKSNDSFQDVVSNIACVIWKAAIVENGTFQNTYISSFADELLGLPAGTIKNNWNKYFSYVKPMYLEGINNSIKEAILSPGKILYFEYEMLKENGQSIWVQSKGRCNEKDGIFYVFGTTTDITDSKNAEEKLKIIFDLAPDAIYLNDLKGNFIDGNKAAEELIGYKKEELIRENLLKLKLIPPKQFPKVLKNLAKNALGKKTGPDEFILNRKDGVQVPVEITSFPVKIKNKPMQLGIARNISDRRKKDKELYESEAKFRLLADYTYDWEYWVNPQGEYIYLSPACEKITGFSAEEFRLKPDLLFELTKPVYLEKVKNHYHDENNENTSAISLKFPIINKNGKEVWIEHNCSPVFDEAGNYMGRRGNNRDITIRKIAEDALQESEERYRTLFLNNPVDTIVVDNSGKITEFNDAKKRPGGKDPAIGKKMYLEYAGKHKKDMHLELMNCINTGIVKKFPELEYGDKGKFLCITIAPYYEGAIITSEDITGRKRAEQIQKVLYNISNAAIVSDNLKKLIGQIQKELGSIIDTTNFYVALDDGKNGEFTLPFIADEKENPTYVPAGKTLTRYVVDSKKPLLAKIGDKKTLVKQGNIEHFGVLSKVWLGVPLKIEGEVTGVLAVQSYTDEFAFNDLDLKMLEFVSDQISSSIHLIKTEQIVKDSEERFKKLSSLTFEGIVIHNNGIAEDVNLGGAKMFGYKPGELIGKNVIELVIAKKHHNIVFENIRNSSAAPYEVEGIKRDGTRFPVEIEARDYSDDGNKKIRVAAVRDLTIRKKAEQDLINALKKATESDRLKSAFLATMSHELRTPLNAIIGFTELINDELPVRDIVSFAKTVNFSGNHLLSIIEDIFDITLIESGVIKVNDKRENLKSVLGDIYEIIKIEQQITNKDNLDLKLTFPGANDELIIQTDAPKLKQILINLLKNSLKFTNQGYINFGYLLKTGSGPAEIEFFVKDTGIGIREEKREFIFDVFRQADDSHTRLYGGVGIGLSIAEKLTRVLGGKIWFETEVGKGTTFYFTIPFNGINGISEPINKESEKKIILLKKLILIVEDDKSNYELLKTVLKKSGMDIIWAKNGIEGIKHCKENPDIDLVIMDINMPEMNGYEATNEIKLFRPELPVIAVTAYALAGDLEKAIGAGCDDYIKKPINRNYLLEIINKQFMRIKLDKK